MRNPYLRTLIPLALHQVAGQAGPGIIINNKGSQEQSFAFFKNAKNGNGWAAPSFNDPDPAVPAVTVGPGSSQYVKIDSSWKGRVQRGTQQPATWAEFQLQDTDNNGRTADGGAHGDISLIQGCDGAVEVASTDGSGARNGFTKDCREGAPAAAIEKKADGSSTLGRLVQNWPGSDINHAAVTWAMGSIDGSKAYMLDASGNAASSGVPDVASKNNCLEFDFY